MFNALRHRTLVVGNSGSGKSTLANRIGAYAGCACVDLDAIHWEDMASGKKHNEELARQLTAAKSEEATWVIEGVYGWLIDVAVPRATALVWLDLPWEECRAGLEQRGLRRDASQSQFNELMMWAEQYWDRRTPSSFAGHLKIYEEFAGQKIVLRSRAEVSGFMHSLE